MKMLKTITFTLLVSISISSIARAENSCVKVAEVTDSRLLADIWATVSDYIAQKYATLDNGYIPEERRLGKRCKKFDDAVATHSSPELRKKKMQQAEAARLAALETQLIAKSEGRLSSDNGHSLRSSLSSDSRLISSEPLITDNKAGR